MTSHRSVPSFGIHFDGGGADAHLLPAPVLIESIAQIQRIADPPLRFHVTYAPEDELYDLDGDFGISISADSRPQLIRELNEVLSMLWIDYAQEEPERLSPKARDLRAELLDRLRVA